MSDVESATDRRMWRHCDSDAACDSPEPRRPCTGVTCGPGSHDHLVDPDQRPRSLVDSSTDQIEWARDLVAGAVPAATPGIPNAGRHAWRRERPSPVSRSQALALIYTALREAQPGIEPWEFHGLAYVLDRLASFSRSDARRIGLSDEPWANAGVTRGLR